MKEKKFRGLRRCAAVIPALLTAAYTLCGCGSTSVAGGAPASKAVVDEPQAVALTQRVLHDFSQTQLYAVFTAAEHIVRDVNTGIEYANNELLLNTQAGVTFEQVSQLAEKHNAKIVGYIEAADVYQLQLAQQLDADKLDALCAEFAREQGVSAATRNTFSGFWSEEAGEVASGTLPRKTPNDARYGEQWAPAAVNADTAWAYADMMTPINLGLIDTPVDGGHNDLSFVKTEYNEGFEAGSMTHGTEVAGVMGALQNNNLGISGMYPLADGHMYSASWLGASADGRVSKMVNEACLTALMIQDVRVINLSYGQRYRGFAIMQGNQAAMDALKEDSTALCDFLNRMLDKGFDFLLVASAGNASGNARSGDHWVADENERYGWREAETQQEYDTGVYIENVPAQFNSDFNYIPYLGTDAAKRVADHILITGACKQTGRGRYQRSAFSNDGDAVSLIAPGEDILSCTSDPEQGYESVDGTSFSAPCAAGAAAMVWSVNPNMTGDMVKQVLIETADVSVAGSQSNLLNAGAAVTTAIARYGTTDGRHLDDLTETGAILGDVSDGETMQRIAGVNISATPTAGGKAAAAVTDAEGSFQLILEPGVYRIEVSSPGCDPVIYENVTVKRGIIRYMNGIALRAALADFTVPDTMTIGIGSTAQIGFAVTPVNAARSGIRWESSDVNCVTAMEQGIVVGNSVGSAVVTATAEINGKTVSHSCNVTVEQTVRDCVLALDFSGSMEGDPQRELIEASKTFCQQLFAASADNRVAFVIFGDKVRTYDFVSTQAEADSIIDGAYDDGMTNMVGALQAAGDLLDAQKRSNAVGSIVVMADGLPNLGNYADHPGAVTNHFGRNCEYEDAVCEAADSLKQRYAIYSLGFYHNAAYWGDSDLEIAEYFLSYIQTDGYYNVQDGAALQFAFGDIAKDISDGSKTLICIACPVDVTIASGNERLSSADDTMMEASFGRILLMGQDHDIKLITLNAGTDYDVLLNGIANGAMDYDIWQYSEDNKLTDRRSFRNVPLNPCMRGIAPTTVSESAELRIDNDGDGDYGTLWTCDANGAGILKETTEELAQPIGVVVGNSGSDIGALPIVLLAAAVLIGIVAYVLLSGRKKPQPAAAEVPAPTPEPYPVSQPAGGSISVLTGSMQNSALQIEANDTVVIGKSVPGVNLILPQEYRTVSKKHCSIRFDAAQNMYYVTDLGSTNGTKLPDGTKLTPQTPTPVAPGTILTIGDGSCQIRVG